MREGSVFRLPDGPDDVATLRRAASPIDPSRRPQWLAAADVDLYLQLAYRAAPDSAAPREEIAELENRGFVVARAGDGAYDLYLPARPDYPEWSIGMVAGCGLAELRAAPGARNPVLTRHDVGDHVSAMVADPFMVPFQGGWTMLFESLNWTANKGEIAVATSTDGLGWTYGGVVLSERFHLSYPHVFGLDGRYYMIPESRQDGTVRLYRATDFPADWRLEAELLTDVSVVDATVFRADGGWWMFAGADGAARHDELRLYYSDRLEGAWSEHPQSPVVRNDPHRARPAGRVVSERGALIRLAQNCDPEYGLDVRAFKIIELTRHCYAECPLVGRPILGAGGTGWRARGGHHVDAHAMDGGWLACVDGWTDAERPSTGC